MAIDKVPVTTGTLHCEHQLSGQNTTIYVNNRPVHYLTSTLASTSLMKQCSGLGEVHFTVDNEVEYEFIQYLETGWCSLRNETLNLMAYAAFKYQMPNLLQKCEEIYLDQLIPENCLENLLFAESHGCQKLANEAFKLAVENFEQLSNSQQFCHIGKSHLLQLIVDPALHKLSSEIVFTAIDRWIGYEENIRSGDRKEIVETFTVVTLERLRTTPDDTVLRRGVPLSQMNVTDLIHPTMSAPGVVCVCWKKADLEVVAVSFHEGKPTMTKIPVPRHQGLSLDSAFCHTPDAIFASGGDSKPYRTSGFDLVTKEWTKLPRMFYNGRKHHTLCYVNGRVYALGGVNAETGRVFEYIDKFNTDTNKWSGAGKLEELVRSAPCVALGEDIYLFGGIYPNGTPCRNVQCYDTSTKQTRNVCQIPNRNSVCRAVTDHMFIYLLLSNGDILEFNPRSEVFRNLPSFKKTLLNFGAFHFKGYLYMFGGTSGRGKQAKRSAEVYRLDLRNDNRDWEYVTSLPQALSVLTCSEAQMDIR